MKDYRILQGDVRDVLGTLEDESVHCCITSPPYWGLRDYQLPASVWGGDTGCEHEWGDVGRPFHPGQVPQTKWQNVSAVADGGRAGSGCYCALCGAWRGTLGLEPTPGEFVQHMVEIFRDVRRVLRRDGTLWLNMGDSYAQDGKWGGQSGGLNISSAAGGYGTIRQTKRRTGLKPKDLVGMPWRCAFALQEDGWYLRSAITWCKRAPMPESVTDRPTSATEMIFLLAKSERYFYDPMGCTSLDTDAVSDVYYEHGNQTLHHMSAGVTADRVLQVQERSQPRLDLQSVRKGTHDSMAANGSGAGIRARYTSQVQSERARQADAFAIQPDGEGTYREGSLQADGSGQGIHSKVSPVREAQGSFEAVLREWQGQSSNRPLPRDTEGHREPSARCTSAARSVGSGGLHADSGAVGTNQADAEPLLRDVWEADGTLDEGPHPTADEGRDAHGGQHTGALPFVQQPQGEQAHVKRGSNLRNFWVLGPEPYPGGHFAVFPTEIPRRAILLSTSERGVCPECGAPWKRVVSDTPEYAALKAERGRWGHDSGDEGAEFGRRKRGGGGAASGSELAALPRQQTTGWQPTCKCGRTDTVPATVLDCFSGAGTTALVALRLGRRAIGIELNPEYIAMSHKRIQGDPRAMNLNMELVEMEESA